MEGKIKEAQVKINERVQDRNRAQHNKDDRMKDLESKRSELDEIMEETRAEGLFIRTEPSDNANGAKAIAILWSS